MGAAEACCYAARSYTLDREPYGKPLAQTDRYADRNRSGLQCALQIGLMFDDHTAPPGLISLMKRNYCGKALSIAREVRETHGANGISNEYGVIRHIMNLDELNTYERTRDAHALILGHGITDLQAFSKWL